MDGDINLSTRLLNSQHINSNMTLPKMFQAKVIQVLPDNVTFVQFGSRELAVFMKENVSKGLEYSFRNTGNTSNSLPVVEILSKDIHPTKSYQTMNTQTVSNEMIANIKNINTNDTMRQIITSLQLRVDKSSFETILNWLNESNGLTKETKFMLIQHVMEKNYPIPLEKALTYVKESINKDNNIGQIIKDSLILLNNSPLKNQYEHKLEHLLRNVTMQSNVLHTTNLVKNVIVQSLTQLGFQYENNILTNFPKMNMISELQGELKPILISLQQRNLSTELNLRLKKMIQMVNGFQLQSREDGNFQPLFFAMPYLYQEQYKNWYFYFQSNIKGNNKVDPTHCRILFLLDLPALSETMIDIFIQEKVISVSITNNFQNLEKIVEKSKRNLLKKLENDGFTLLKLKVIKNEDKNQDVYNTFLQEILKSPRRGMDIKI